MAGILRYANQGATRNLPLVPGLAGNLESAVASVYGPGAYVQVYSGGQPGKGEGGARTGSIRHDHGRAADVRVFGADGNQITGDGLAPLGQFWRANNFGGVGLEMHGGGVHLDDWVKPPPGGGMNWDYSRQGGRYTDVMASAIAAGNKGVMPTLLGSAPSTSSTPSAPEQTGDTPAMAFNDSPRRSPAAAAIDQQTTGSVPPSPASALSPASPSNSNGSLLGGILDFNNPQTLIALQLIANGQKAPGQAFDGVPELAAYGAKMTEAKQQKAAQQQRVNQTRQWLEKNRPELAPLMDSGMDPADVWRYALKPTEKDEYQKRKDAMAQAGIDPASPEGQRYFLTGNMPAANAGDETFFGNPVAIENEDGSISYGQIGNKGSFRPIQLGAGQKFAPPTKQIDGGTETLQVDQAGNVIARIPKNVSQTEAEKAAGKAQGEAQAAMPAVEGAASELLASVDSLYNDPYLGSMLGPLNSRLPNTTSDAARVQSKMDQIGGQSFLQAFNTLRGAGQITEVEGAKATAAMARLNTAQNEKDYKAALDELRGVVSRAVGRSRQKAGQSSAPPAAESQSNDYKSRYGLD